MSRFAARLARMEAAVNAEHGERVTVEPRLAGEFLAGGADPDRPAYDGVAIFDLNPIAPMMHRQSNIAGSSTGAGAQLAGGLVEFSFVIATLPPLRTLWPRQGDRIVRLLDGARYLVAEADSDGSRWNARCSPEKAGS
jgi:hypothetical protein